MRAHNRLAKALERLEQQVKEQQSLRPGKEREAAEQRRWEETLERFGNVLPEDLWDRVKTALQDECCRLWDWLKNIVRGRSRLPDCLTPEVMRRLVLIRLEEADRCESWEAVCLRCGLQYPMHKSPSLSEWRLAPGCSAAERPLRYDLPHFFDHDGCPACGASSKVGEMNWAHLIEDGYWFPRP
ncbi:MAG TPA: hypothetical protein VEL76_02815 [Gemmataceae bacterium]|nr:hypothetical protein [Gemmataceae bacterium]